METFADSNPQISLQLAKQAVAQMYELGVASTPKNFTIWYDHQAQSNPELSGVIQQLLDQQVQFTAKLCQDLYQRFYGEDYSARLDQTREAIRDIIEQISSELNSGRHELTQFESSLSFCESALADGPDLATLKQLVARLLKDTRDTRSKTDRMGKSMTRLSLEVNELRSQIEQINSEVALDPLTKLANRLAFEREYQQLVNDAIYRGYGLSLIMIDIDHFKKLNQLHGPIIADQLLRFVAAIIKKNIKGQDFAARYSGDRFIVILPDTNKLSAEALANQIRLKICAQELIAGRKKSSVGKISISCGVASFSEGDTQDSLLERTDRCLRNSKQLGRNQVSAVELDA